MSLDLYIESKTPILHRGTGVYIRENGETKELATKQEVLAHFPDSNLDEVMERSYEDNEYFHMKITHNLTDMAEECKSDEDTIDLNDATNLYDLLWNPESIGVTTPSLSYLRLLIECYQNLLAEPDYYKQWEPKNGWGSYEGLVRNTQNYIKALAAIIDKFEDYTIVVSK